MIKNKRTSGRSLVLTFDDGYQCLYSNVFPVLKKYHIPATMFLTTGFINNNDDIFWYDKLIYLFANTQEKSFIFPEISDKRYWLHGNKNKRIVYAEFNVFFKKLDNNYKNILLYKLSNVLKVNLKTTSGIRQMLTWAQVKEMHQSGLVTFGAHTVSHPILTKVPLISAQEEINESKKIRRRIG